MTLNVPASLPFSPPAAMAGPPLAGGAGTFNLPGPEPEGARDAGQSLRAGELALDGPVRAESPQPSPRRVPDRVVEVRHQHPAIRRYAALAWQTAGENQAARNWKPREDYTETGWTRRSATELAIQLAREQLDAGFDHIVGYATSGMSPRWTEVA